MTEGRTRPPVSVFGRAFREVCRWIIYLYFGTLHRVRWRGVERVPADGPVILAANHQSYYDPLFVAAPVPRVVHYMAWDRIFSVPVLGRLAVFLGAFPVDTERADRRSLRAAREVLGRGDVLGIFPEAGRGDAGGHLVKMKPGAARLSLATGAPVVPVSLWGAFRAWSRHRRWPMPGRIRVVYHPPVPPPPVDPAGGPQALREAQEAMMQSIVARIDRTVRRGLRAEARIERLYAGPPRGPRILDLLPAGLAGWAVALGHASPVALLVPALHLAYLAAERIALPRRRTVRWVRDGLPVLAGLALWPFVTGLPWGTTLVGLLIVVTHLPHLGAQRAERLLVGLWAAWILLVAAGAEGVRAAVLAGPLGTAVDLGLAGAMVVWALGAGGPFRRRALGFAGGYLLLCGLAAASLASGVQTDLALAVALGASGGALGLVVRYAPGRPVPRAGN